MYSNEAQKVSGVIEKGDDIQFTAVALREGNLVTSQQFNEIETSVKQMVMW